MIRKDKCYRNGIFAVTYCRDSDNKTKYVLLKRHKHWKGWEFPKGKVESLELKRNTVKREVFEETGLKVLKVKSFNVKGDYKYEFSLRDRPGIVGQTYKLYAVEIEKGKINVDKEEHTRGEWVYFEEAYKKLTWPNQRKCLKIVNNWLNK